MYVYALYDRKMREYGQLGFAKSNFVIQRSLVDSLQAAPDSLMAKHPEDFDLMQLGTFDPESGELSGSIPTLVVNVGDLFPEGRDGEA